MAKKKIKALRKPNIYEFKISLVGTNPLVWRKVIAHDFIELSELHMLIQMSMGWEARHLYSFEINGQTYTDAETAFENKFLEADGPLLCDVRGGTKKFSYTYDFGDEWLHTIEIINTLDIDSRMKYPVCVGGENACPPEDSGGVHGFEELKNILSGDDSEEKDEMLSWVGGFFDPKTFDPNFVNRHLLWPDMDDDLSV